MIAIEYQEYREDDQKKTDSHEIFRNEVEIHGPKSYGMQQEESYDFSLPGAPSIGESGGGVAGAIVSGMQIMSGSRRYVKWHIEARLDCPGLDLVTRKNVSVS